MLKGVLFDMDGVIVDTEPLHHKAYNGMFDEVGIDVSPQLYQSFTGQSTINICRKLCDHFSLSEAPETLVQLKRNNFKHLFANDPSLTLIDGVLDIIKEYYENDLKLVLASSASMMTINNVFERFDLNQYFIAKFSGADLKQSKPHPEIFEKAAFATGYERSNCMVIEDSTNGIKAANAAGIFCVGYDSIHSKNQDYSIANMVISDFKEIQHVNRYLLRWNFYKKGALFVAKKAKRGAKEKIQKYGFWGLMLFVMIPIPGTGVYAGTIATYLFNIERKKAFLANTIGIFFSSVIVWVTFYYGFSFFD